MSTGVRLARPFLAWRSLSSFVRLLLLAMVGLGGPVVGGATLESLEVTSDPVDEWYVAGDDITVRATFDEAVRIEHSPNLKLLIDIGSTRREAALGADAPARQFTFTYRVQDGDNDTDGISIETGAFTGGTFVDQDDRTTVNVATTTLATLAGHKVDTMAPTVAAAPVIISDPGADDTYVAGDRIEFEITFDQDVRVSGNPELILSIGRNRATPSPALSRRATLVRTRPTQLTFRYVVQAGDFDDDGIRIQADALQGGVIEDLRGNPTRRELAATTYTDHDVDTLEPAVIGVELTSAPARGDTYGEGEIIEVEVTFDEVVYVSPVLSVILDIGTNQPQRHANYVSGSGTPKLTFRYRVQQQDEDDDGISIGPNALDGGNIEDEAGNRYAAVDRRIDPVREQPNHKVDGGFVNPTVTRVTIRSSPPSGQSGFYRLGDVIEVEVDFNVPVYVAEPREESDDEELRLVLGIGQHSRFAVFAEGGGTTTLIFRYTVQAGDLDEDGISVGPAGTLGQVSLVGARVVDGEGNTVNRRFSALPADRGHKVDAVRPAATGVAVTSQPGADGRYGRGERIVVAVTLNEAVHVVQTADDVLVLLLQIGENTRRARFFAGSGTKQLMFRYTVRTSDRDDDGLTVGPDALTGAVLEDEAGNDWAVADRRLPPLRPARGNRVAGDRGDDGAPVVTAVGIRPPAGTYTLNERIVIDVTFSEVVHVQGAPTLALVVGGVVRPAALLDGSGTSTLSFGYTVQAGDEDVDGVSMGPDALADGAILDGAGNEAVRDFEPLGAQSDYKIDAKPPEIVLEEPEILNRQSVYGLGDSIRILLRYTEPVYVTSTTPNRLRLEISIGELSRQADYVTGSGSREIEFGYIVQVGDRDDDGISIGPDALSGGVIEDSAGNDWGGLNRRILPLPERGSPRVDAGVAGHQRPSVRSVEIRSTPVQATYRTGDAIEVAITFSVQPDRGRDPDATVHVSGQPTLELQIGTESRQAALVDGSGTETLTFRYVVQAGDYDEDGISIGAGPASLSGGTIRDASGNDADRGFEGLEADERHKVNAIRPTITDVAIMSDPVADDSYRRGERVEVEIRFSRQIHVSGQPTLELQIGTESRQASLVDGNGTETLTFRYVVQAGDYDEDGISIGAGPASLSGGTIRDASGNDADRGFEGLEADDRHRVNAVPTITRVTIVSEPAADGNYRGGERVAVEIRFSRQVHVSGRPTLELQIGTESRQASLVDGSGTETLTFRYVVQAGDYDGDGISIGAGPASLSVGTIRDDSGNDADRGFEGLDADDRHRVNAVPTITGVAIVSEPAADGNYREGERVEVEIGFSRQVHVGGEPMLELQVGTASRQAALVDGGGTATLTFRYVVLAGDYDEDGISIGAGPTVLSGGTIRDASGNDAYRGFERLGADIGHKVNAVPTITRVAIVSDPVADDTYRRGERVEVEIRFSRQVHVSGQPTLELQIGTASRQASLVDGSGTKTLTFGYVVQAGDHDADGISIGAGPASLSGGTIRDVGGNDADRGFEGLGADPNERHKVNAVRPTITRVAIVSTPAANNAYREGERIDVEIDYSDDVRVIDASGSLVLELTIGENKVKAALVAPRTDARKLVFRYTVRSGDYDADGISIGADALQDGRIVDDVGDEVDRTFDPLPNQSGHMVRAEVVLQRSLNLTVGGAPAVFNVYNDILIPQNIRHYRGGYRDPVSDDRNVATARVSSVYRLVITPVAEGTANIVVVAQDAAIALGFVVTVTANAAEVAVLEHALAAMGRGILASAANTIGTRLESVRRQPSAMGGRRIRVLPSTGGGTGQQAHALDAEAGRWGSAVACAPVTPCGANWDNAYGSGAATDAPFDGSDAWQSPRSRGMGRGGSFEMPLIGVNRGTSWALWGAGDFQTFEGEPELARYDGDVSAAYLGVDARGENWLAGAAVGRVQAQADYQFTVGDRTSRGNLETKLTVLSPYVQWPLGERGKMWALAGVGVGEATIKREGRPSPVEPTDLTMRMGLAGLRTEIAEAGNFRFAVRGEIGSVQLETKKGETAVHGLAVNAQRARVGVEASFPMVSPTGAEFTPFADIGGRFDGGDGQTGGGIEVAAGVRASSPLVRFEAKARTLALHGADGYAETGASATVIVEPGEQGRGLRLSLAPRWGGADDAMDVFWRQDAGNGLRAFNREMERGWGVASRVDYGVAVAGRRGAAASVRPFGEVDLVDDDNRRMRVGMTYQLDSMDKPLRFELSSERVEQPAGTEHRFLLSAEGRF